MHVLVLESFQNLLLFLQIMKMRTNISEIHKQTTTKEAISKIITADNKIAFVPHTWVFKQNYISYTRIYGMTLEFMAFFAAKPYLHMVLKTPRASRDVLIAPRCPGNINYSECFVPRLPRWNRLIARLSWE